MHRVPRSRSGWRQAPALLAAALALGLALAPAAARAGKGEHLGAWSLAASLGYAVPNTDEYGNAFAWRLAAGYSPLPQFELDLELGRFGTDVSQPEPGGIPAHTIASGSLEVTPVCLTAQYRAPLPELLSTLTLHAGVGYYFIDYEMGDEQRAAFEKAGAGLPDQDVDDAWGFHAGAGLEYALGETVSLFADGRYLFLEPSASGTAAGGRAIEGSLDLNTWVFSGGVKVVF